MTCDYFEDLRLQIQTLEAECGCGPGTKSSIITEAGCNQFLNFNVVLIYKRLRPFCPTNTKHGTQIGTWPAPMLLSPEVLS